MFSVSGAPRSSDVVVLLDGKDMKFVPRQDVGLDRWHYEIPSPRNESLSSGKHQISFVMGSTASPGQVQVCSVEVVEYGNESEFDASPGAVSLFPTFSDQNRTSYRPTNDACLMRRVVNSEFCAPCLEALWLALLKLIDLIEKVNVGCSSRDDELSKAISLTLLPLAQFRESRWLGSREAYNVEWRRNGVILPEFANKTVVPVRESAAYDVTVRFHTPSVRKDPRRRLISRRSFIVVDMGDSCPELVDEVEESPFDDL